MNGGVNIFDTNSEIPALACDENFSFYSAHAERGSSSHAATLLREQCGATAVGRHPPPAQ